MKTYSTFEGKPGVLAASPNPILSGYLCRPCVSWSVVRAWPLSGILMGVCGQGIVPLSDVMETEALSAPSGQAGPFLEVQGPIPE